MCAYCFFPKCVPIWNHVIVHTRLTLCTCALGNVQGWGFVVTPFNISELIVNLGPPSIHSPDEELEDDNLLPKKIRLEQQNHDAFEDLHNGEEYGFTLTHNDDSDQEELEHETTEKIETFEEQQQRYQQIDKATLNSYIGPEEVNDIEVVAGQKDQELHETVYQVQNEPPPPPVPPRSHSLSPPSTSPSLTPFHDLTYGGRVDIYGDNSTFSQELVNNGNGTTTRPFLGQGRGGGDTTASPPLPVNHAEARSTATTTVATPMSPDEDTPPPLPVKRGPRRSQAASPPSQHLLDIQEEEQALMSILDELERSISRTDPTASVGKKNEAVPVINRMANEVSVGGSAEKL